MALLPTVPSLGGQVGWVSMNGSRKTGNVYGFVLTKWKLMTSILNGGLKFKSAG